MLRRESAFNGGEGGGPERRLMRRILLRFLPQTLGRVFLAPMGSVRRLAFAMGTLFYVALGYISGRFELLGMLTRSKFER